MSIIRALPSPGSAGHTEAVGREPYRWLDEPVGLYLHVPFCQSKCIYCDFNSYARMEDQHEPFVAALCADLRRGVAGSLPGTPDCAGSEVSTVFFGGGTPSVLLPEQIEAILSAARDRYAFADGAEITMEANPGTISLEAFEGYRAAGVNRLSMGVQVLDDAMLRKLGRIHTSEGALESYALARSAGFDNINLDFIIGLPGQDLAHLDSGLGRLLDVSPLPEHLSVYTLIVEENTPLYTGVRRGLIQVPVDDEVAEMYELTSDRLTAAGYAQYEISNWSRGRPCRHNLIYWEGQRYLAFGPGASGYWGDRRYSTVLAPRKYIELVRARQSVVRETETLDTAAQMGEYMMLCLRLNHGVSHEAFERRFGERLDRVYRRQIDRFFAAELLEIDDVGVRLTTRGRLLGNEVFAAFI